MKHDLCVRNAKIVTADALFDGELYVKEGKVAAVTAPGAALEAEKVVDAQGSYLLPGVIDPHLHGGHGTPDRETFVCAGMAAAAGGITTVLEQPLSNPSTVTVQAFLDKKREADQSFVVDFGLWGGLVPGHLDEMEEIFRLGGGAFKSFMCRCSNYPSTNDGVLLEGMRKLAAFGGLSAVHAENDTLIQELADRFQAQGRTDARAFLDSHPPYSELEAVLRYLFLARQAPGCKAHVVHCSLPEGVEAVHKAQEEGVDVTVETCPQYLGLCEDDLLALGGVAKCDPPVRPRETVERLWECVKAGKVDMIASDHSPHPFDRKVVDRDNFPHAAEGVTGLQTMLPVILTEGVVKRGLGLTDVVRMMCRNPAKRFGLYGRKGALEPGFDADFILVDMEKRWVCQAEKMHYLNKHTPFHGRTFQGSVEETYVRGRLVCKDNQILVKPGFGRYCPMEMNR